METTTVDVVKYNAYKTALEFVLGRSPISGNGGVRVLKFVGFVNRKGLGIVTTSKTDYYLGGADKDADSVFAYQNMPEGYKNLFRKYENELSAKDPNNPLDITEPRGVVEGLVKKYPTEPEQIANETPEQYQNRIIKWRREQYTDMLDVDKRIEVARMARRGKQNIGHIVNGMIRMQTLYDMIEQQGSGSIEMKGKYYVKGRKYEEKYKDKDGVEGKREVFKPASYKEDIVKVYLSKSRGSAKELQLDTYNIVNLMADSADFMSMPRYNEILDAVWNKYFFVNSPQSKLQNRNWQQANKQYDGLRVLKELHSTTHDASKLKNSLHFNQTAEDYIAYWQNWNDYYFQSADVIKRFPNFQIDPFKYYKSIVDPRGKIGYEPFTIIKAYTKVLRDQVVKSPYFKDFELADSYLTDFEARKDLEYLTENPDMLHRKFQEYLGVNIALKASDQFIRDTASRKDTAFTDLTAKDVVIEVIDNAYLIKSFYDSNRHMMRELIQRSETITEEIGSHNIKVEDMNRIIGSMKNKYKVKYPELYTDIETLFEFWLMAHPVMSPKTDFQARQLIDIEQQSGKINELIKKVRDNKGKIEADDPELQKLLSVKNAAYNKYKPYLDMTLKLVTVNPDNKRAFMKAKESITIDSIQKIHDRITRDTNQFNIDEFAFNLPNGEWTFDIANRNNSESLQSRYFQEQEGKMVLKKGVKPEGTDTPKLSDMVNNNRERLFKELPQFQWRTFTEKGNKPITEAADKAMNRTIDILKKNPDVIQRFEELFIDMNVRLHAVGKRLDTLTVKELEMFNDALEERFSAKSIVDKTSGKLLRKPKWIEQMLNYQVIGKQLENFEKLSYEKRAVPILNKFGDLKIMNVQLPTSSLELGRQTIDKFDTFQKIQNPAMDDKIDGLFKYINVDHKNVVKYERTLFEAAVNSIEYQNNQYPSGETSKAGKKLIKDAYEDSKRVLKTLDKEGIKFPLKGKMVSGIQFAAQIRKDVEIYLKQINTGYIESRWKNIASILKGYNIPGLSIRKDKNGVIQSITGTWKPSNPVAPGQN